MSQPSGAVHPPGSAEPSSPQSSASALPYSRAPAVNDPLPESVVSGDPCEALTRQQIEQALGENAPEGTPKETEAGPGCNWQDSQSGAGFTVFFSNVTGQGLSAYYANTQPQVKVWRELPPIEGFPAVAYKTADDDLICSVAVGLADEFAVDVVGGLGRAADNQVDPCDAMQALAALVVQNLRQKAGR
ncbi:DUF3558 domain-containing protein [Prauserella oleivorans]